MALTLRSVKGSALTQAELDADLSGLASGANMTAAFSVPTASPTFVGLTLTGTTSQLANSAPDTVQATSSGAISGFNLGSLIAGQGASNFSYNRANGFTSIFTGLFGALVESFRVDGTGLTVALKGLMVNNMGAFVAGDKYVIVDAGGHFHVSGLGPAS